MQDLIKNVEYINYNVENDKKVYLYSYMVKILRMYIVIINELMKDKMTKAYNIKSRKELISHISTAKSAIKHSIYKIKKDMF